MEGGRTRHDLPPGRLGQRAGLGDEGNGFAVGDNDAGGYNPNATAWNPTRRVLSLWHKGGFSPMYVCVTTSVGSKFINYYTNNGTDFVDQNGTVRVYPGWSAEGLDEEAAGQRKYSGSPEGKSPAKKGARGISVFPRLVPIMDVTDFLA